MLCISVLQSHYRIGRLYILQQIIIRPNASDGPSRGGQSWPDSWRLRIGCFLSRLLLILIIIIVNFGFIVLINVVRLLNIERFCRTRLLFIFSLRPHWGEVTLNWNWWLARRGGRTESLVSLMTWFVVSRLEPGRRWHVLVHDQIFVHLLIHLGLDMGSDCLFSKWVSHLNG